MSEPTEPSERPERPEPHTSAFGSGRGSNDDTNPWLAAMAYIGGFVAFVGVLVYALGYDDATSTSLFGDTDPAAGLAAMFAGQVMISGGVGLLVLWVGVSAVCWQLRRRP